LRRMREHGPAGMEIAAGEYGYDAVYFRRMLQAGSVDVLQADATRCAGVTGFLQADALCRGYGLALSAHTAPSLHGHLCCAAIAARNVEYFYDHARIEKMCFDGALQPENGLLRPDPSQPGLGLELKRSDIERYRVYGIDY
ncbi:MAG: enolase C-terminal domain-like protein, partial [Bryobacteraceae bacterium]